MPYRSAMRRDYMLDYGEPESRSALLGREVGREYAPLELLRYAGAVVPYLEPTIAAILRFDKIGSYPYMAGAAHGLGGVGHEIPQELFYVAPVGAQKQPARYARYIYA